MAALSPSTRALRARPPAHAELARRKAELEEAGRPVLDLAASIPAGELSRELREVGERAWRDGDVGWVPGAGLPDLRDAVLDWLDLRWVRTAEEVVIAPGTRAATAAVIAALTSPGDTVLVDAAGWSSVRGVVAATGATPIPVVPADDPATHRLLLTAEDVRHHLYLHPGARVVMLASPVNPTAQVYDADRLWGILEACLAADVTLVVDRLYGRLIYDGAFPVLPPSDGVRERVVLVDGIGRAIRGASGLRVGWAAGPRAVMDAVTDLLAQGPGPADRVAQRVALAALRAPYDLGMVEDLRLHRDALLEFVARVEGLEAWPVPATSFALLDAASLLGRSTPVGWLLETAADLAEHLLDDAGVLLAPADIPGRPGFLRVSFTEPPPRLAQGFGAIRQSIARLT